MNQRVSRIRVVACAAALTLLPVSAGAQLAVVANDGKSVMIDGVVSVPADPAPDYVAVIDLGAKPPKGRRRGRGAGGRCRPAAERGGCAE